MKRKKIVIAVTLALSLAQNPGLAQFNPVVELSDLNGQNGITINGATAGDYSGISVSSAGDINGDGIDDLIIGASRASPGGNNYAGSSYVVFGSDSTLPNPIDLVNINGLNGFTLNGVEAVDQSGASVSAAGDVNGDGFDDLIIGAPRAVPDGNSFSGSSYVVFGTSNQFPNPFNLSTINGINGFTLNGVSGNTLSGTSVSGAGDINGDGIADLIIGAPLASPGSNSEAGSSYVVFGSNSFLPNPFELSSINGTNGFTINGVAAGDYSGRFVGAAGDINGDGIDDLIIGAYKASPAGNSAAGSSYVVFGSDSSLPHPLNLSTINGLNGFTINGISGGDYSGRSVSAAGDVNGDGIDDLIIGASTASPGGVNEVGSSYVVFGSAGPLPNPLNLSTLNGTNGFSINGVAVGDNSGGSVSSAGDVNGDGKADLIIGAFGVNSFTGSNYVVFGSDSPQPNPIELATLNGSNGFSINGVAGSDYAGFSVSDAGDINGDGIADVIIGAIGASPNAINNAGSSYVVFGNDVIFKDGFE